MRISWTSRAWDDYLFWQKTDKVKLKRINTIITDVLRNPHEGIGSPEALKHDLAGFWSRRIDREHRIVYSIEEGVIVIVACRYHY